MLDLKDHFEHQSQNYPPVKLLRQCHIKRLIGVLKIGSFRDRSDQNRARAVRYQKYFFVICIWPLCWDYFFRKGKMDNERKTKDGLDTEEAVPPTEYEHNSSLRVDLLDTFPDLDSNIRFFNYRVSSTEIKLGAFIFFVFFRRTSPAAHCSYENPKQIRMAQLSLRKLSL